MLQLKCLRGIMFVTHSAHQANGEAWQRRHNRGGSAARTTLRNRSIGAAVVCAVEDPPRGLRSVGRRVRITRLER